MTVLSQYQRLECAGVWRSDDQAQRKNVFVTLGDATLVIMSEQDVALSHWSLPALDRLNPGARPAQYRPGAQSSETLELSDETMIAAIETVRGAIRRQRPHRGRLRGVARWAVAGVMVLAALLWLPGALRQHSAQALPAPLKAEIGDRLMRALVPVTGPACTASAGLRSADTLGARLFGPDAPRIAVLSGGPVRTMALPGGTLLIHRDLIETPARAEVPAGYLLAEAARAEAAPPLERLLDSAGIWTAVRLLTTGRLPDAVLQRYAEILPLTAPEPAGDLAQPFAAAGVSPVPYLSDLVARGGPQLAIDGADPATQRPVLNDADWLRLQDICAQ